MTDYTKFQNWKNSHFLEMQDLEFSKPFDIFIFVRFTQKVPVVLESKQVLFAETLSEAIGYVRHIFLYDIFNDIVDDIQTDFKVNFDWQQTDAVSIFNYWFKLGKIPIDDNSNILLKKYCKKFNSEFSDRDNNEYEIQILSDANELRRFLNKHFSESENFDKKKLCDICSNDFFVPKLLKEYIDLLL